VIAKNDALHRTLSRLAARARAVGRVNTSEPFRRSRGSLPCARLSIALWQESAGPGPPSPQTQRSGPPARYAAFASHNVCCFYGPFRFGFTTFASIRDVPQAVRKQDRFPLRGNPTFAPRAVERRNATVHPKRSIADICRFGKLGVPDGMRIVNAVFWLGLYLIVIRIVVFDGPAELIGGAIIPAICGIAIDWLLRRRHREKSN
jgi:hypothetical protein